jgi:hypothetical protein
LGTVRSSGRRNIDARTRFRRAIALTLRAIGLCYYRPSLSIAGHKAMGVRGKPTAWNDLYSSARWLRIRQHQLREHPLCKHCAEIGMVEPATICDHVEPHHGDLNKFWSGPFQSLASAAMTVRSARSRCAAIVVILGSMAIRSIRAIRSMRTGDKLEEVDATTLAKTAVLSK